MKKLPSRCSTYSADMVYGVAHKYTLGQDEVIGVCKTDRTFNGLLINPHRVAEEEGFEPPCELPRKRFSRPPVSTTHPFLRSYPTGLHPDSQRPTPTR